MKKVAVMSCVLSVEPAEGSPGVGGVAAISSGFSTKVLASSPVLIEGTQFSVIGVTAAGGYVQPVPAYGALRATAQKVSAEGAPVVLEGDQGEVNVTLVQVSTGTSIQASMIVKVDIAGQSDVRAN